MNKESIKNENSVSILLGENFFDPEKYHAERINEAVLKFTPNDGDFNSYGELVVSPTGERQVSMSLGIPNAHQKIFWYCQNWMKVWADDNNGNFDYEAFFDFTQFSEFQKNDYTKDQRLCLLNMETVFKQIVAHCIKKEYGGDNPLQEDCVKNYENLFHLLEILCKQGIVNVHTLNCDLLFEAYARNKAIEISDGFSAENSLYYGKSCNGEIQLAQYNGHYDGTLRYYKMHGSLDYVPYERQLKFPDGVCLGMLTKKVGDSIVPDNTNFYADFLIGSKSKQSTYSSLQKTASGCFYKELADHFADNLAKSKKLIIIGYDGCNEHVNAILTKNKAAKIYIFDPKPSEALKDLAEELGTVPIVKGVSKIDINDFE